MYGASDKEAVEHTDGGRIGSTRKRPRAEHDALEMKLETRIDKDAEQTVRHAARLEALLASAKSRLAVSEKARSESSEISANLVAESEATAREMSVALERALVKEAELNDQLQEASNSILELKAELV